MGAEPVGVTMNFTDYSILIRDAVTPANNFASSGIVANGELIGPGAKVTYAGPAKNLLQADGVLRYQAHNLMTYSNDFSNAIYTKNRVTVTVDAVSAPGGGFADKIVEDGTAANNHRIYQNVTTSGGPASYTVRLKAAGRSWAYLQLNTVALNPAAWFNLSTGAVGTVQTGCTASIAAVSDGFYDCTISITDAIIGINSVLLGLAEADNDVIHNGDGVSGVYATRAHFRRLPSNSDYIETTATTKFALPYTYNASGVCLGILPEDTRTNLALQSNTFSSATWSKSRATITANTVTSPSGLVDASTLTDDGVLGTHRIFQQITKAASALTYTASCYFKAGSLGFANLRVADTGETNRSSVGIDLTTGVVSATTNAGTFTASSAVSEDVGNGWWRLCLTFTTSTDTLLFIMPHVSNSLSSNPSSYTGIGDYIYIWQAQLELAATATSPIMTTTTAVTRTIDDAQLLATLFQLNTSTSTLFASAPAYSTRSAQSWLVTLAATAAAQRFLEMYVFSGTAISTYGGAGTVASTVPIADTGVALRCAAAVAANDSILSVNGTLSAQDTTVTVGQTPDRMFIGRLVNNALNGPIASVGYWPRRRPDAELQALGT